VPCSIYNSPVYYTPTPYILYPVNNIVVVTATPTRTPIPPPPPPPPPPVVVTQVPPPPPPVTAVAAATPEPPRRLPLPPNTGQGGEGIDQTFASDPLTLALGAFMVLAAAAVGTVAWRARRRSS
jgi:hypothetical protein